MIENPKEDTDAVIRVQIRNRIAELQRLKEQLPQAMEKLKADVESEAVKQAFGVSGDSYDVPSAYSEIKEAVEKL